PSRFDDAPALGDVVADRLLDVDVLAVLHGPDGREGVPVVRRGDGDDVDGLVVHDPAQVLLVLGSLALRLLYGVHGAGDDVLVHVADGDDLAVVLVGEAPNVAHAATVNADHGHVEPVVSVAFLLGLGLVRGQETAASQQRRQRRRVLEEITPTEESHARDSL